MFAFVESFLDVALAASLVLFGGLEEVAVGGCGDEVGVGGEPSVGGGDVGGDDGVVPVAEFEDTGAGEEGLVFGVDVCFFHFVGASFVF